MSADKYQRNARECFAHAGATKDPQERASLLATAQTWLRLAEQATKNMTNDISYEMPPRHDEGVRPAQQQQQPQSKKNDDEQ